MNKIRLIWSMRKFTFKYIDWRLTTAYPDGWKFVVFHPIVFLKDLNKFLIWCDELDNRC